MAMGHFDTRMNLEVYIYTYIHIYIYTYIHIYIYTYIHIYIGAYTHEGFAGPPVDHEGQGQLQRQCCDRERSCGKTKNGANTKVFFERVLQVNIRVCASIPMAMGHFDTRMNLESLHIYIYTYIIYIGIHTQGLGDHLQGDLDRHVPRLFQLLCCDRERSCGKRKRRKQEGVL